MEGCRSKMSLAEVTHERHEPAAGALGTGSDVNVQRTACFNVPVPGPCPHPNAQGLETVVSCLGCTLESSGGILEAVNTKDRATAIEQALCWRPGAPVVLITLQLTQVLSQSEDSWCKCREERFKYSAVHEQKRRPVLL